MIIILEGCDKCGKTTLANELIKEFSAVPIKCSQPKTNNPKQEYIDLFKSLDDDKNYVVDRAHLGEFVYGPIYRGYHLDVDDLKNMESHIKGKAVVVYCWNDHDVIKSNFIKDKEEFTNINDIEKIDYGFRCIIMKSKIPVIYYNYFKNTFKQNINQIKEKFNGML